MLMVECPSAVQAAAQDPAQLITTHRMSLSAGHQRLLTISDSGECADFYRDGMDFAPGWRQHLLLPLPTGSHSPYRSRRDRAE